MGVVYKAHDPVIDREVALKAIQLSFEVTEEEKQVYLSRFYREAQAAGKLSHPSIVTIYDAGEDKDTGIPFIVMEFLEGTTLQEVISSGNLLPLPDLNTIMVQIADALHYAHNQGVVHRDIKSANILIVEGLRPKITDFGIAKLPSSDLTRTGQFVGTPNYMSPEQIEGKAQIDGRSDLFSLGVIFYMLLTGERPFGGDNFSTVSYKIVHVDPPPPRVVNPAIPEAYNKILGKLLAKELEQRYQTGEDLAEDLRKARNDEPIADASAIANEETLTLGTRATPAAEKASMQTADDQSGQTSTVRPVAFRRWIPVTGALILLALAVGAGIKLMTPPKTPPPPVQTKSPPAIHNEGETLRSVSKQNTIRTKWDLAVNYYTNGIYDKSIVELNELLAIDPNHEEAKKYLELVKTKQESEEKKKQAPLNVRRNPALASQKPKIQAQEPPAPSAPEIKTERVQFELEHTFPSGKFSLYHDGKLIYQTILSGKEKKVLMIRTYSGKVTGFVDLPVGKSTLGLSLICKELGVSVYKTLKTDLKEGAARVLKLRYVKATKQLDAKWT